ncbi:Undefined function [Listeria monocytogenes]|nr:Undefined function [Listeria monocytogenes]
MALRCNKTKKKTRKIKKGAGELAFKKLILVLTIAALFLGFKIVVALFYQGKIQQQVKYIL